MLHLEVKEKSGFWLCLFLSTWLVTGCKQADSTTQDEEDTYLADYESPEFPWGYMDTTGLLVIKAQYDDAALFNEGLAAVNKEGRWGYIDHSGNEIIKPAFKAAWAFHEGFARVSPFSGNDHFLSRSGKVVSSTEWSAVDDFSEGLAKVKVGNTFGYVDTSGQIVIKPIYSRCWNFENGVAVISTDEKLGLIDAKGLEILPQQYNSIKRISGTTFLMAIRDEETVIYDFSGRELHRFEGITGLDGDGKVLSVRKADKVFLLSLKEEKLIAGSGWNNLYYLGDERWAARQDTSYFLINNENQKVSLKPFKQINRFVDGYAAYYTGKHWGYMDRDGKDLSPDLFELAWDYKNGYARAAFTEGIAFINRNLKLAFYPPPGTMDMRDFSEGLAPVQIGHQ